MSTTISAAVLFVTATTLLVLVATLIFLVLWYAAERPTPVTRAPTPAPVIPVEPTTNLVHPSWGEPDNTWGAPTYNYGTTNANPSDPWGPVLVAAPQANDGWGPPPTRWGIDDEDIPSSPLSELRFAPMGTESDDENYDPRSSTTLPLSITRARSPPLLPFVPSTLPIIPPITPVPSVKRHTVNVLPLHLQILRRRSSFNDTSPLPRID